MTSAIDLDRSFKAGLHAYQHGDYQRAIIALSQVARSDNSAYRIKANMGLVKVYIKQNNWSDARSLCQKVGTSSKPALQQWSQKTLATIDHQIRLASAAPSQSGFVPLTETAIAANKTGFQPLEFQNQLKASQFNRPHPRQSRYRIRPRRKKR